MDSTVHIFSLVQIVISVIIIVLAFIYSIPIVCVRRFHQPNNIFTVNACIATILCILTWLPVSVIGISDYSTTLSVTIIISLSILQTVFTIQVPLSFVIVSLHRYCSLVYHMKMFFKQKKWFILCIGSQWILGFILTIPIIVCFRSSCILLSWPYYYLVIIMVIFPSIIFFVINMLIYQYVRSSSRRIQPQTISVDIQQGNLNRRDILLLRHMILMFCVFVGGWAPVFILSIFEYYMSFNSILDLSLTTLCILALLFNIIDLFLYNHELRKYLKDICLRCF